MKILPAKRGIILLCVILLATLAALALLFAYVKETESRLNKIGEEMEKLSEIIRSLEETSPEMLIAIDAMKQNIGELREKTEKKYQKSDTESYDNSEISGMKSVLENIAKQLAELNIHVENLKIHGGIAVPGLTDSQTEGGDKPEPADNTLTVSLEEDTEEVPDTGVPTDPAVPEEQAYEPGVIKAGQEFIVYVKADEVQNLYGYQFRLNYDKNRAIYTGKLASEINGISTIFSKEMDDHLLVGATMIGNTPGYTGQNETVCKILFTANEDIDPSDFAISNVNTVDADQNYIENISGWSIELEAGSQD